MKRLIFVLMILVLVFSVFAANSMFVFAEGEDASTETEETVPGEEENEGTEEGGEELPPENEGTEEGGEELPPENEGTEEGGEELPPETEDEVVEDETTEEPTEEPTEETEEGKLSDELFALVGELKDEFVSLFEDVWNFIISNETYKSIFTALLAVVAILLIPVFLAVLVIAFVAMTVIIWVAGALMTLLEGIVAMVVAAGLIL